MTNNEAFDIKHPQVIAFAKAMDEVLTKNDHKGGWGKDKCLESYLRARLVEEMGEYFALIANDSDNGTNIDGGNLDKHINTVKKELIDISNFAMMLWDRS